MTSTLERLNAYIRRSATIKLIGVAFLALLLLIPTSLVDDLVRERRYLRDAAVAEISGTWGGAQHLAGPVLQVPYTEQIVTRDADGDERTSTRRGSAYFLPESVDIAADATSEERYRGIYVAVLYTGTARVRARFDSLAVDRLPTSADNLDWSRAALAFGVSDLRGIDSLSELTFAGRGYGFEPSVPANSILSTGFQAPLRLDGPPTRADLTFAVEFRGSSALHFAPLAATTEVRLASDWATPKFEGAFLPDEREVTDEGFTARWEVLDVNRPFPQEGTEASRADFGQVATEAYGFGTHFLLAVDDYRKTARSAKYAALFVAATFLTFFFIEVLNGRRVHPVQYLLIGFAVVLFYVLLLSLSEHVGFEAAYGLAMVLILLLVGGYSWAVLRTRKLAGLVVGILVVLYGFFYGLLQLEDYSLLLGSLGLLLSLAVVMYLTRRTDWYNLSAPADNSDL